MATISKEQHYILEEKWLGMTVSKTPRTLVVGIHNDFAPYIFINAEGQPAGLFVDLWRRWVSGLRLPRGRGLEAYYEKTQGNCLPGGLNGTTIPDFIGYRFGCRAAVRQQSDYGPTGL